MTEKFQNIYGLHDNFDHPSGYSAYELRSIIRDWFSADFITDEQLYALDIRCIGFIDSNLVFLIDEKKFICFGGTKDDKKAFDEIEVSTVASVMKEELLGKLKEKADVLEFKRKK